MDDLRWILAAVGAVIVIAIYFSGRFEREEWRRDRGEYSKIPKPKIKPVKDKRPARQVQPQDKKEPQINFEKKASSNDTSKTRRSDISDLNTEVKEEAREKISGDAGSAVEDTQKVGKAKQADTPAKREIPKETVSVGINSEADVEKALGISEPPSEKSISEKSIEEPQQAGENWERAVESAREPLIEDEIVEVEIPEEISGLDKKPEAETDLKFRSDVEEPVQQELMLEIEPLVLVLTVMAKGDEYFNGNLIKKVLENSGLTNDDKGIFHFHMTGKRDAIFSVVSVIEPGIFDMGTINEYNTPGLSFFCQLPGPLSNTDMFRIMHMKALNIAEKLGGKLCDDKRNLLTEQATRHYNDRIKEFDREVVLAMKKGE